MFLKVRRDTLIILLLAFMLIFSGRLINYVSFASSYQDTDGIPITGIMIKGNDIVSIDVIKQNVANAGFRVGSYIKGNILITSKRSLPLDDAIRNAELYATMSTIQGTKLQPIVAADVKVDNQTGIVVVNVVEDFAGAIRYNENSTYQIN
ncbi:MAG: hypothetical protein LBT66_05770 [Methanobrevibacter sp.]|jgi:hypothetical protein|nr:hypothetical protein [Candidatus Methanovirga meridionalis]